jgi:hypothetical protein
MNGRPPQPRTSVLTGWFYLAAAIVVGLVAMWDIGARLAVMSWPETRAEVVDASLYQTKRPARWCAQVLYRYQVGGRDYASHRVSSSRIEGYRCDHDEYTMLTRMRRMQPGAQVTVRYKPDNPAQAVIHADGLEANDAFFGGAALLLLAGGIYTIRKARKQQAGGNPA